MAVRLRRVMLTPNKQGFVDVGETELKQRSSSAVLPTQFDHGNELSYTVSFNLGLVVFLLPFPFLVIYADAG